MESQLRGYTCIFHKPLVADEVAEPVFRAITEGTGSRFELLRRDCRLTGVAVGQKIRICDLYAPQTALEPVPPINCKIGVKTLLCALQQFDINCARRAEEFSLKNWADGKQRPGKRGGAFCSCTHGKHSSLLLSHTVAIAH